MLIGYAERDVTPPIGSLLTGYGTYLDRRAKGVLDPLMCRVVVFRSDEATCALAQCDLIGFDEHFTRRVRERLQKATGLPPEAVMLHCSHTHSGPATLDIRGIGSPDPNTMTVLEARICQTVKAALEHPRQAARFRECHLPCQSIGFNRTRHGTAVDHSLRGLRIDRSDARPVLFLHHSCHPVVLGVNHDISADYPGGVAREIGAWGYHGGYLNGPCGDIDPLSNASHWGSGTAETIRIYGHYLAEKGFAGLEQADDFVESGPLFATRLIDLPLNPPDRDSVVAIQERARKVLETEPESPMARLDNEWAADVLASLDRPEPPTAIQAELQAFSLGKVVLVALPGEVFTELGLRIVKAFPDRNVFVLNTCNGVISYIPTADEFSEDSYAAFAAFKYFRSLPLRKGAGEFLADEAIRLVRSIAE